MRTTKRLILKFLPAIATAAVVFAGAAYGQTLAPNQTFGYSDNHLEIFTYTQSFDCVDQATDDLDYNHMLAQSDSGEFQTPICQAGTNPTIDPTGAKPNPQHFLYVLIPFFSVNDDQNPNDAMPCPPEVRLSTICGPTLGRTLIKLFGWIPEAYKTHPLVYTQCPAPGEPPGTCTMHSSTDDLGKVLVALGKLSKPTNVFLPSPNHSHVIANAEATQSAIWWEVRPVLVLTLADWPTANASSGITSVASLKLAEKEGDAIEVPDNFFLFFSAKPVSGTMDMPGSM